MCMKSTKNIVSEVLSYLPILVLGFGERGPQGCHPNTG